MNVYARARKMAQLEADIHRHVENGEKDLACIRLHGAGWVWVCDVERVIDKYRLLDK